MFGVLAVIVPSAWLVVPVLVAVGKKDASLYLVQHWICVSCLVSSSLSGRGWDLFGAVDHNSAMKDLAKLADNFPAMFVCHLIPSH